MQRRATCVVNDMRELPYEELLCRLNFFNLGRSRLREDLILAYRMFKDRFDLLQMDFCEAVAGMTSSFVAVCCGLLSEAFHPVESVSRLNCQCYHV